MRNQSKKYCTYGWKSVSKLIILLGKVSRKITWKALSTPFPIKKNYTGLICWSRQQKIWLKEMVQYITLWNSPKHEVEIFCKCSLDLRPFKFLSGTKPTVYSIPFQNELISSTKEFLWNNFLMSRMLPTAKIFIIQDISSFPLSQRWWQQVKCNCLIQTTIWDTWFHFCCSYGYWYSVVSPNWIVKGFLFLFHRYEGSALHVLV